MEMKFVKAVTLPIGIDLGTSTVKVAQLRLQGDAIDLLAAGAIEIPRSCRKNPQARLDFTGQALRDILKVHPFKGRHCVISMPAESVVIRHLKLPRLSEQETIKAIRWELDGKLPCHIDDAVVRHVFAGEGGGDGEAKQEYIVICAARSDIDGYLKMARRAKLDVMSIGPEVCAVTECFGRLFRRASDATRTIMFVDMGASSTQVALTQGNHIVFARNIGFGGDQFDKAVADAMKLPFEQAGAMRRDIRKAGENEAAEHELYSHLIEPLNDISDQLTQCLRYHESVFRNQNIERVIFVGGQAYDKKLCQLIAQRLNLPAQVGDPLLKFNRVEGAGLDVGLDRRQPQPDWAVAIGLSLGAAEAA